ncbi:TIGR02270 family protein [Melittangium boletus]|uniref:TIGR02270 family protein n=1 Tax=Melittangium boletus TaxID=83453 RepID=UPI003DA323E8
MAPPPSRSGVVRGARRILWDVLEEHLEEAAFLWRQRERALVAPDERLEDLADGDEARLLAHLRGLVTGGAAAAERLLRPTLAAEEPQRTGVAAWSLLAMQEEDGTIPVLRAMETAEDAPRAGLMRALALSERPGLDAALLRSALCLQPWPRAGVLEALVHRRADVGPLLGGLSPGASPPIWRAALHACRLVPLPMASEWLGGAMEHSRPDLQEAARVTGLIHHLREPWLQCREEVEQGRVQGRVPLLALAISGGMREAELLIEALRGPLPRDEVLWALGFCGRIPVAEVLLEVLREEASWLAADSFATITGLPLDEPRFLEKADADEYDPEEDVEDTRAAEEAVAELPGPAAPDLKVRVAEVEAWWREARPRLDARGRYLLGSPWSAKGLVEAMERVSLRRRPVLAWELAVRSLGACQVEPRAWARVQRASLTRARDVRLAVQSFDVLMKRGI